MFDPAKYGAVLAAPARATQPTGFDPAKYGATPVGQTTTSQLPADANSTVSNNSQSQGFGDKIAAEQLAGGQKIVDSVTTAADKFNSTGDVFGKDGFSNLAKKTGALLEGGLGAAAGGVQTIFAPLSATFKTVTDAIENRISDDPKVQSFANSPAVSSLLDHIGSSIAPLQKLAIDHPDAAKNIVDGLNVALAALGGKIPLGETPVSTALSTAKNDVVGALDKVMPNLNPGEAGVDALSKISGNVPIAKSGKAALDEAVNISKPTLTPLEKEAAFKQGRVETKGILGNKVVTPSTADQRIAESIQPLVEDGRISVKNTPEQNIEQISTEVSRINQDVGGFVKDNKIPFNENQLRAKLNAAKGDSNLVFASEPTAEKTYNAVVDEFISQVKNKDTSGLFEARQNFDDVPAIKKLLENEKFGENVKREIVLDVRRAANDYIAEQLPENSPFKAMLSKETNMLRAIDNIANANRGSIDTNIIQRLFKAHPILKYGVSSLVGGGTAAGVLKVLGN